MIGESLKKEFMIKGEVVFKVKEFCGIEVYQTQAEGYSEKLYFVKGDKVVQALEIEADCGQNVGYISELKWED